MAADSMAAFAKITDLRGLKEILFADPVCSNEKMAAQAVGFEVIGDVGVSTGPRIIECDQNARFRLGDCAKLLPQRFAVDCVVVQQRNVHHATFSCRSPMKIWLSSSTLPSQDSTSISFEID